LPWTPGEDAVEKLTYEAEKQWVQKALLLLPVVL
jgi:hypothetical protein